MSTRNNNFAVLAMLTHKFVEDPVRKVAARCGL